MVQAAQEIGVFHWKPLKPQTFSLGKIPALTAIVPAAMHAQHSLQKHRQENDVHADERRPEMHLAPELVHRRRPVAFGNQ